MKNPATKVINTAKCIINNLLFLFNLGFDESFFQIVVTAIPTNAAVTNNIRSNRKKLAAT